MHCTQENDNYIVIYADRAGPDSVGQGWVLGSGTGRRRDVRGRARQRKTGPGSVGKCPTVLDGVKQNRGQ